MIRRVFHQWIGGGGFTLIEIMVATALGGMLIYGGVNYMSSVSETYERIEARNEDVVMTGQKLFSTKFLDLINRSIPSISYFTLLVKYTQQCGGPQEVANGPCFFSLTEGGERAGFDKTLVKSPTKIGDGINFFDDHILSEKKDDYREEELAEGYIKYTPRKVRYDSDVIRSKEKRFYVGWSLKSVGGKPFYIMSSPKKRLAHLSFNLPDGTTIDPDQNQKRQDLVFAKPSKEIEAGDIKEYKNRFYLAAYSHDPRLHFVMRVKDLESCRQGPKTSKKATSDCKKDHPQGKKGTLDKDEEALLASQYKMTLTNCSKDFCYKFFSEYSSKIQSGNKTFPYGTGKFNLFFFESFNIKIPAGTAPKMIQPPSLNPLHFANISAIPTPNLAPAGTTKMVMLPIEFYKFYLAQDSNSKKKLIMESDKVYGSGVSNVQTLMNKLDPEDQIIFARRLGSHQFSGFLFNNKTQ